jgi:hypothetical protein
MLVLWTSFALFKKESDYKILLEESFKDLGIVYKTPVTITLLQSRNEGNTHEIFRNWYHEGSSTLFWCKQFE